jgi:protein SCO1/2
MLRLSRLLIAAAALALAACSNSGSGPAFHGTDITGADYGKSFALTDHTGHPRTLADFRGKVVTLFFGYTQCPDVCPTNLTTMGEVMRLLGKDADRVQVLFVTVSGKNYTVDHSAGTYVFDPQGRLRLYLKHGETAQNIAADLRRLLDGA